MRDPSIQELCSKIVSILEASRSMLLRWFRARGRDFPWRTERDPYKLLITEMLLRRTRAHKVAEIYHEFFKKFPNAASLAEADPGEVHTMLHSLGLRWRVDTILATAKELVNRYNGAVPEEEKELLELPGVGFYVARAVRIFAYSKNHILIDSNTLRIFCRWTGRQCGESLRKSRDFLSCLDKKVADFSPDEIKLINLALIDLGSLICLPRRPLCKDCPLAKFCVTGRAVAHPGRTTVP